MDSLYNHLGPKLFDDNTEDGANVDGAATVVSDVTTATTNVKPAILPGLSAPFSQPDNGKFKTSSRGRLIVRPARFDD